MAQDATGTPSTNYSIPKHNTAVDAPSGKGTNAIVDFLDSLLGSSATLLGAIARTTVRKNSGADVGSRRRINFIEGTGVTLTVADDGANEEVDVTIAAASGTSPQIYDRQTSLTEVVSTATETSFYSKSIAGGDMSTNKMLRLTIVGDYLQNNSATDTANIKITFGGTTIFDSGTVRLDNSSGSISANRHPWILNLYVTNQGAANSNHIVAQMFVHRPGQAAPTTGAGDFLEASTPSLIGGSNGLSTIDTASVQTLDVLFKWSAASANNSWRARYALLELV